MAKKTNKSSAIRDLYKQNPKIKAQEVISTLAAQGIKVSKNLVYLVKGKGQGEQIHRHKLQKSAAKAAHTSGNKDIVEILTKLKALAGQVGGYESLRKLMDILES